MMMMAQEEEEEEDSKQRRLIFPEIVRSWAASFFSLRLIGEGIPRVILKKYAYVSTQCKVANE